MPDNPRAEVDQTLQDCVEECQRCHSVCFQTAMVSCLERGGDHIDPEHFRLMLNCAEICQTAANFMLSGSPLHGTVCLACAEICDACAKSCERLGDMQQCVGICRSCADRCRSMAD